MGVREPVAMEIPLEEGAAARVPPRIRRRLLEGRTGAGGGGGGQTSAEEIEARLKEAEQRRQVGVSVSVSVSLVFLPFTLLFPLLPPHGGLHHEL
jgi:hypothetical protein